MRRLRALLGSSASLLVLTLAVPVAAQTSGTAPAAQARPASHFMIRAIQVKGNHWLPATTVEDIVYPFTGPDKNADDVEKARAALQKAFEAKGYATVSVFIPEQSVDSGIIRLEIQAQAIGKVAVTGTDKTQRVLAEAPSLRPGAVPNFQDVQHDIVALNAAPNRKVTPDVRAGAAPGTVDVTLKVEQSSPLHGSLELNNFASPSTSDLRISASLRDDNMFGRGDSLSISTQVAPRRIDDGSVVSANYLAHVGKIELLAYIVHSSSDISIVGGTDVIGKGDMGGVRVIVPLSQSESFYQSLTAGIDYKNFKEDVALGADSSNAPIEYFPATLSWRGDWTGDRAKSFVSVSAVFGIRGLGDDLAQFDYKRYNAKPDFFYLRGEAASTLDLWKGFQFYEHFSGQWSNSPLISNEQFSVGGSDTVRGYYESETLGDEGFATQFELRSPLLFKTLLFDKDLRLLGFFDDGYTAINDPLIGQIGHNVLASVGGGVRLSVFHHFNGALDVGLPLKDGPNTRSGDVFARFRIWGEF